jgi:two-component system chemotaxis sensor kinase CheA
MADEMLTDFIHEATEHLATGETLLLGLAKATAVDPEAVNACFRSLHTVKGCAGFLDLHRIKGLAHAGEQVLDALRSGRIPGSPAAWDILLTTVSRLEEQVQALAATEHEPPGSDQDVIAALEAVLTVPEIEPASIAALASAVEAKGSVRIGASADACIAALIACGTGEVETVRHQLVRLRAIARRDGWQPEAGAILARMEARAAGLGGPGADAAMADLYVEAAALQDSLAAGRPLSGEIPAAAPPPAQQPTTSVLARTVPLLPANPLAGLGISAERAREMLRDFASECDELIAFAEGVALGKDSFTADQVNGVFRSFHTIKGMAAYLQQPAIEQVAHAFESRLMPVRDGQAPADQAFIQTVLAGVDQLRTLVATVRSAAPEAGAEGSPLSESGAPRLGDLLVEQGVDRAVVEAAAATLKPNERLGDKLVETGKVSRKQVEQAAQVQAQARAGDGFSRVATGKLEELVNMVGELLIAQAMVVHDPDLPRFPGLSQAVQRQSRILRSLQVLSLSLRMVPLRATFQKMARAVHDTARKLGKHIDFQTAGEETEIDRTLAEAMADPLLHMVRNAVDHGIEPAERRRAAGKGEAGKVRLEAYHAGDDVVIQLTDDGGGMDPQRLRKKAVEKGLIPADRAMTDQECFDLIFLPGFSTAAQVTDVSGRGVGMDVVRRQVRNANGSVRIDSVLGKGSTFTIRLPLTTAIMDTMLLRVGEQRFLIPVASVVSMLRPAAGQVESLLTHGRVLNIRGRELPVITLGAFFSIPDHQADPQQSLLLVVENRGRDFALQVDEVLGQRQVVIKPFDHSLAHHQGVSGSAILGDGRVALILNPARLLGTAGGDDQS